MSSSPSSQHSKHEKLTKSPSTTFPHRQSRWTTTPTSDRSSRKYEDLTKSTSSTSTDPFGPISAKLKTQASSVETKKPSFQPFEDDDVPFPDLSALKITSERDRAVVMKAKGIQSASLANASPPGPSGSAKLPQTPYTPSSYTVKTPRSGVQFSPYTPATSQSSVPVTPLTPWDHAGSDEEDFYGPKKDVGVWKAKRPEARLQTFSREERFLQILGVSDEISNDRVEQYIARIGKAKKVACFYLGGQRLIIASFSDKGESSKVSQQIRLSASADDRVQPLGNVRCIELNQQEVARMVTDQATLAGLVDGTSSIVLVSIGGHRPVSRDNVQKLLAQFGDIATVTCTDQQGYAFEVDFFDAQDAAQAVDAYHFASFEGGRTLSLSLKNALPTASILRPSQGFGSGFTLGSASYRQGALPGPLGHRLDVLSKQHKQTSALEANSSLLSKHNSLPQDFGKPSLGDEYDLPGHIAPPGSPQYSPFSRRASEISSSHGHYNGAFSRSFSHPTQSATSRFFNPNQAIPEENRVIPERILSGLDHRTTVMVKDVPNKLSRQELVNILAEVVPGEFDFVYLRFDFKNCCNVGYAFVNFTSVAALYTFMQARVGQKWNLFSSEKVLQISYANIQGKQNLINKFRNSAVMGVMEAWRPQIFYSSGARQGQPEPFPGTDNIYVARRSQEAQLNRLSGSSAPAMSKNDNYDYDYASSAFNNGYGF